LLQNAKQQGWIQQDDQLLFYLNRLTILLFTATSRERAMDMDTNAQKKHNQNLNRG